MADNSNVMTKSPFNLYFAAEAGEWGAKQYEHVGPGEQLEMVVRMMSGQASARQIEQYARRLPEVMAYADFDAAGFARMREVKTKDLSFIGPASGVGSSTVKGLGVVPILAGDAVMEGAAPMVCAREVVKKRNMQSSVESMPFFTSSVYLKPNSPGSEATDIAQDIGKNMLKCKTFRSMAKVSKELVRDSVTNIKSDALREMGKSHEMTINRYVFTELANFAGNTVGIAASGSDETNMIDGVLRAQSEIADDGFVADKAVLWPRPHKEVFSKLVPMYNIGAQEQVEGSRPLKYGGLEFYYTSVSAAAANEISGITTAYSFGWGTASTAKTSSSIGALVLDSSRSGELGILEEMEFEEFSDPIKYLEAPIINMRWDFKTAVDDQDSSRTNANAVAAVYMHS